jgi:hypothetical protein
MSLFTNLRHARFERTDKSSMWPLWVVDCTRPTHRESSVALESANRRLPPCCAPLLNRERASTQNTRLQIPAYLKRNEENDRVKKMSVKPYHNHLEPSEDAVMALLDLRKFRDLIAGEELYFRHADLYPFRSNGRTHADSDGIQKVSAYRQQTVTGTAGTPRARGLRGRAAATVRCPLYSTPSRVRFLSRQRWEACRLCLEAFRLWEKHSIWRLRCACSMPDRGKRFMWNDASLLAGNRLSPARRPWSVS